VVEFHGYASGCFWVQGHLVGMVGIWEVLVGFMSFLDGGGVSWVSGGGSQVGGASRVFQGH
jgi:hypothetical protein